MKNENVAIFDIRSYSLTFLIGGKGVNGTFLFRGTESDTYEGYGTNGFYDERSFVSTATRLLNAVLSTYDGNVKKLYIATPAPFLKVFGKGQTTSFEKRRKITEAEIDALYAAGLNELAQSGMHAERSAMYFSIGDNRRYFSVNDILGAKTTILQGALCYYFVEDTFFALTQKLFASYGFGEIEYVPQPLSMATYLLPQKTREGYAALLDVGYAASAISIVYGGGIVKTESFDCGVAQIVSELMGEFDVSFDRAEEILAYADISGGAVPRDAVWSDRDGNVYPVQRVNDVIKCALDELCEKVDDFFERCFVGKKIATDSNNPLYLTGEGVRAVKGFSDHAERRLCRVTQTVFPDIPFYDKPNYSSRISALYTALQKEEERSGIRQFFNLFGGKKK